MFNSGFFDEKKTNIYQIERKYDRLPVSKKSRGQISYHNVILPIGPFFQVFLMLTKKGQTLKQ